MSQLSTNENTWLKNICIGGIAIGTSYLAYQLYKQYFLKPKNKK